MKPNYPLRALECFKKFTLPREGRKRACEFPGRDLLALKGLLGRVGWTFGAGIQSGQFNEERFQLLIVVVFE